MKFRNQLGPLFWIAVAGVVCLDSIHAGIGTFRSPRSGFFPFWLGVILAILGLVLAFVNLSRGERGKITDLWKDTRWSRVVLVIILTLIYSILLNTWGFLITTFLLMSVLLCVGERERIWTKIVIALFLVLASYVIFHSWLKVPLPKGILNL
jgi:putative tricarboxylic transport membrane protein